MKEVQEILEDSHFLRTHRQYIMNLNHVKLMNKNDNILTLDNRMEMPISRSQKDIFSDKYKWL